MAQQNNRPRVQLSYNVGGSALDAAPYSLTGRPTTKPDYLQQRIQASVGGPLKIPKVFDAGPRTTFFVNYSGTSTTCSTATDILMPRRGRHRLIRRRSSILDRPAEERIASARRCRRCSTCAEPARRATELHY
jgi:hypothetical protein